MSKVFVSPGLHIICGLQGGGKSHLIRYIMHEKRRTLLWGIVFTQTKFGGGNFDYIPEKFVHEQYSPAKLIALKKLQKKLIEEGKSPAAFVIFDDCLYGKIWNDPELLSLCTQLRHYNITCIISTQYPYAIPPTLRSNAFTVSMFMMTAEPALKGLYESFGQMFDSFNEFRKYLFANTGDHSFLLFDARIGGTTVAERYHVMKAPSDIPPFMMKMRGKI